MQMGQSYNKLTALYCLPRDVLCFFGGGAVKRALLENN